ncbi:hypothetical protein ACFVH6_05515 [Spirillospora sp. NPDC127200]
MRGDEAGRFLTDADGIMVYQWVAVTIDPVISEDPVVLAAAREKLAGELFQEYGTVPDAVLLLPVAKAGELLGTAFDDTDPDAVVMIAATAWDWEQGGDQPGDVRRVPTDEWSEDEWSEVLATLKPDTPPEVAEAAVSYWREHGSPGDRE